MAEEEEKEIWKEINGFPDYKVSTFGNILSFRKYRNGKILKLFPDKYGYYIISLYKNKKIKTAKVHRLVALNFLPNYYGLPQVDHKDRNRQNNSIYNLRWVTLSEQNINKSNYRTDILETDPKTRKAITTKQSYQRAIDSKKYYCETCNVACQSNYVLQIHYKTKTHLTRESNESTN